MNNNVLCSNCNSNNTQYSDVLESAFCLECSTVTEAKTAKKVFAAYTSKHYPYNYSEDELFLILSFGGVIKVAAAKPKGLAEIYKWFEYRDPTTKEGLGLNKSQIQQINSRLTEGDDAAIVIAKKLTDDEKSNLMNVLFRIFKLNNGPSIAEAAGLIRIARTIETNYSLFTVFIIENTNFNQDELLDAISNIKLQFVKFKKNGELTEMSFFDEPNGEEEVEKNKSLKSIKNKTSTLSKNTEKQSSNNLEKALITGDFSNISKKITPTNKTNITFNSTKSKLKSSSSLKSSKKPRISGFLKLILIITLLLLFIYSGSIINYFFNNESYIERVQTDTDSTITEVSTEIKSNDKITQVKPQEVKKNESNKIKKSTSIKTKKNTIKVLAQKYFSQAIDKSIKKDYDGAILEVTLAISYDKDNWKYYAKRGDLYNLKHALDKSLNDYSRAIEINPNYIAGYWYLGIIYSKKNNLSKACSEFNKAIGLGYDFKYSQSNRQLYKKVCGSQDVKNDNLTITKILNGTIYKKRNKFLQTAYVQNLTTGENIFSDRNGNFSIKIKIGDKLRFSKAKLDPLEFSITNATISYHVNRGNIFNVTLLKKDSKLGN